MRSYSITFNFSSHAAQKYEFITQVIKMNCLGYLKFAASTVFVAYNGDARQLYHLFTPYIDEWDDFLVIEVTEECNGRLSDDDWETLGSILGDIE